MMIEQLEARRLMSGDDPHTHEPPPPDANGMWKYVPGEWEEVDPLV